MSYIDLYGETHLDFDDILNPILSKSYKFPRYSVKTDYDTSHGFLLHENCNGVISSKSTPLSKKFGLYAVYENKPNHKTRLLYCGIGVVSHRIGRFVSVLKGMNRHDETHPAAEKYRKDGGTIDHLLVMFHFLNKEILPPNLDVKELDERLAFLLKSEYNKKVKVHPY